jgi:hypothetical protein
MNLISIDRALVVSLDKSFVASYPWRSAHEVSMKALWQQTLWASVATMNTRALHKATEPT